MVHFFHVILFSMQCKSTLNPQLLSPSLVCLNSSHFLRKKIALPETVVSSLIFVLLVTGICRLCKIQEIKRRDFLRCFISRLLSKNAISRFCSDLLFEE